MNDLKYLLNIKKLLILKTLFCIFTFSVVRIKSATAVISDAANKVLEAFGVVIVADAKSVDVFGVGGIGVFNVIEIGVIGVVIFGVGGIGLGGIGVGGVCVGGIGVFDVIEIGVIGVFDVIEIGVIGVFVFDVICVKID